MIAISQFLPKYLRVLALNLQNILTDSTALFCGSYIQHMIPVKRMFLQNAMNVRVLYYLTTSSFIIITRLINTMTTTLKTAVEYSFLKLFFFILIKWQRSGGGVYVCLKIKNKLNRPRLSCN